MGLGEEISWGQRIFNFKTPELFREINVQHEFNIHNIEMFNYRNFDHTRKSDLAAMLTITRLYNIFWFSYGILIPILNRLSSLISYWLKKINLPVMPIWRRLPSNSQQLGAQ
jgi:hypothetical protein